MSAARTDFSHRGTATLIALFLFVIGVGLVPISAHSHYFVQGGKECRTISYQWGTDWASFDIHVRGIGCAKARYWIRRDKGSWDGVPWKNCQSWTRPRGDRWNGIAHTDFRCLSPDLTKKIVWSNS